MVRSARGLGLAGILAALLIAATAGTATAGEVTSALDNGGIGTLRYELTASATAGETITFSGAIDPVVEDTPIQITVPGLKLVGNGASTNTISATGMPHRLIINDVTALGTEIRGVTLTGGHGPDGAMFGAAGGNGGAIQDLGSMTLDSVRVVTNSAGDGANGSFGLPGVPNGGGGGGGGDGGWGGGVVHENAGTTLTVRNSYFSDNAAGDAGDGGAGGLGTVMGGAGGSPGLGGSGGGIALFDGTLEVVNTTVESNFAGDSGTCGAPGMPGGVAAAPKNGGAGGGIHSNGSGMLDSVTVADNIAGAPSVAANCTGTGNPGLGGGIGGAAFVARSIVSSNTGGTNSNCDGTADSGNNIVFPGGTGCTDFEVADPLLAGPALNGAQTETLAIGIASPAFGRYSVNCPARDQRGLPRPSFALCDIGAFEIACTEPIGLPGCPVPVVPGVPAATTTPPPLTTVSTAPKKCKKGRKLKKGKCVKKKRKK